MQVHGKKTHLFISLVYDFLLFFIFPVPTTKLTISTLTENYHPLAMSVMISEKRKGVRIANLRTRCLYRLAHTLHLGNILHNINVLRYPYCLISIHTEIVFEFVEDKQEV